MPEDQNTLTHADGEPKDDSPRFIFTLCEKGKEMKQFLSTVFFVGVIFNAGMALFNVANQSPNDLVMINMGSMLCFGIALLYVQQEK